MKAIYRLELRIQIAFDLQSLNELGVAVITLIRNRQVRTRQQFGNFLVLAKQESCDGREKLIWFPDRERSVLPEKSLVW